LFILYLQDLKANSIIFIYSSNTNQASMYHKIEKMRETIQKWWIES